MLTDGLNTKYRLDIQYLQDPSKVFQDSPVIVVEFVFAQLQGVVGQGVVQDYASLKSDTDHVERTVPTGLHISWDEPCRHVVNFACYAPCRKDLGGGMHNGESEAVQLSTDR